ncbi:hypothetical protein G9A89_002233 [Geosiphon pyriformis]|nr:hypothetical protein G9A89_002233 [Geosiphon pyriformis]
MSQKRIKENNTFEYLDNEPKKNGMLSNGLDDPQFSSSSGFTTNFFDEKGTTEDNKDKIMKMDSQMTLQEWLKQLSNSELDYQAVADSAAEIANGFERFARALSSIPALESHSLSSSEIKNSESEDQENSSYDSEFNSNQTESDQEDEESIILSAREDDEDQDNSNEHNDYDSPQKSGIDSSSNRKSTSPDSSWTRSSSASSSSENSSHNSPDSQSDLSSPFSVSASSSSKREWTKERRIALNDDFIRYFRRRAKIMPFSQLQLSREVVDLATEDIGINLHKVISNYLNRRAIPIRPPLLVAIERWIDEEKSERGRIHRRRRSSL